MKFLKYFLIIPLFLNAELVIEITKGSDNPYRIALIPFQGESGAAKQANEIVKDDLIRTGEFYIFDENYKPYLLELNACKPAYILSDDSNEIKKMKKKIRNILYNNLFLKVVKGEKIDIEDYGFVKLF